MQAKKVLRNQPSPLPLEDSKQLARYVVEFHRRFALPLCCLLFAPLAIALGVQSPRTRGGGNANRNVFFGTLALVLYYLVLAFVSALGEQANSLPGIVIWVPNLLLFFFARRSFLQMDTENWHSLGERFDGLWKRWVNRFTREFSLQRSK